jgi:hypothetical protein
MISTERKRELFNEFRYTVEIELGGKVLETTWLGSVKPHHVKCSRDHDCYPRPSDVVHGRGICTQLGCQNRSKGIWSSFLSSVNNWGGEVIETEYLGAHIPHRIVCAYGHKVSPQPRMILAGQGICRVCAHKPEIAEQRFRDALDLMGATLLETEWLGSITPHRIMCVSGHECTPMPINVSNGQGVCRLCANKEWDVFYIVGTNTERIKFGITSGNPQPRLWAHKRDGYTEVIRLYTNLPDPLALQTERTIKRMLSLKNIKPVQGREYFPAIALPIVLREADKLCS